MKREVRSGARCVLPRWLSALWCRLLAVDQRAYFLDLVQRNPINVSILDRGPMLGVPDWWLTAGAVFQTVWNVLDGRNPGAGIGLRRLLLRRFRSLLRSRGCGDPAC